MQTMKYAEARELIKNGDLVHVFRPKLQWRFSSLVHALIGLFTGSKIYHNMIAIWMTTPNGLPRLMCVESNIKGGKRIVPLSIYEGKDMMVQALPAYGDFTAMEELLMMNVGTAPYNLLDFVSIGGREAFGLKLKNHTGGQVCSELCADALIAAHLPLLDTLISPGKLFADLQKIGIEPSIKIEP